MHLKLIKKKSQAVTKEKNDCFPKQNKIKTKKKFISKAKKKQNMMD